MNTDVEDVTRAAHATATKLVEEWMGAGPLEGITSVAASYLEADDFRTLRDRLTLALVASFVDGVDYCAARAGKDPR